MAKRLVVMEMGHRALHGLEVEKRLAEFQVQDYHVQAWAGDPFTEKPAPDQPAPSWASRFESWPFSRVGLITAFPAELCSFRLLELPFVQPKKIRQIVAFEAEGHLPFDLDDLLLEYLPAWRRETATDVLIAGIDKEQFAGFMAGLLEAGIDPAAVGLSGLCLYALSSLEAVNGIRCRGYLDIGARQSRLCVVRDGLPVHVGSLALGGDDLTRLLAEEFHLSWEDAEQGKIREGRVGVEAEGLSSQEARVVKTLEQGLEPLWQWLENQQRYLEKFRPGVDEIISWQEMVLCGGTANLRGLSEAVLRRLSIPARVFRLPERMLTEDKPIPAEVHPLLAEPLALALSDQQGSINFRKGAFAYRRESQIYRQKLLVPAVLLLLVFLSMGSRWLVTRSGVLHQIKEIQMRMNQEAENRMSVPPSGDPVVFVEQKLKQAEAKLEKYKALQGAKAMAVLAASSEKMPAEVAVELSKYTYNEDRVQFEGETADFNSAKQIQDYLQTVPFFSKVTLEDTRQSASGKTRFSIQISLGRPDKEKDKEKAKP